MSEYVNLIPGFCREVLTMLTCAGYEAYVVGGAVRDMVMGRPISDFDITTSAFPEETCRVLEGAGVRYLTVGIKHGTVTALVSGNEVEITSFRVDGKYTDLRRPDDVVFTRSIEEDVKRRDYTINAMYLDMNGEVTDLTGGLEDIRKKVIRAVGNPDVRFEEDALRIMRGLRFAAQTGFDIDGETFSAMKRHADSLKQISSERIAIELNGLVTAPSASKVIRDSIPVLSVIIPELERCQGFDQRSKYHDRDVLEHTLAVLDGIPVDDKTGRRDLSLSLAALFHDIGKPECFFLTPKGIGHMFGHPVRSAEIADRVLTELKYPNDVRKEVDILIRYHDHYPSPEKSNVHRFICDIGRDNADRLFILQRADIAAHAPEGRKRGGLLDEIIAAGKELEKEDAVYDVRDLRISGNDIIDLGVTPGPGVGKMLNEIFDAYIDGKIHNDHGELVSYAARLRNINSLYKI